jgi:hypothetical protein
MYPAVKNYDSLSPELFEEYFKKWPEELNHIPKEVIESWIYRHWSDFQDWIPLQPEKWKYELCEFNNDQILEIDHVGNWLPQLKSWGRELLKGNHRKTTWLGQYMLEYGSTPTPIIIGKNFSEIYHPIEFGEQKMKVPYQLIEGHLRLSYLNGMISEGYSTLMKKHKVWVVTYP